MGMFSMIKARNAGAKYAKGDIAGALQLYKEAMADGLKDMRYILSYSVILIREGSFAEARELLVKVQKYPMTEDQRAQLFVNYATCVYKMGETQKGIELLERQHQKQPCGLIYETLGYLYVESGETEKAIAFNTEAYEYDEEDSITLDNLGQAYYRLQNDKEKAKEYFDKAIEIKPGQIDTLYFLAQYDIEAGNKEAAKQKLEKALDGRFSPLNYVNREQIETLIKTL